MKDLFGSLLCALGIHSFAWMPHDRPYIFWTYMLWCQRGCGNFVVRVCHRDEHGAEHHPEPA